MQDKHIKTNILAHDKMSGKYDKLHVEIFNAIEQERLHATLKRALDLIHTSSSPKLGLDYGCGTGNLTKHLIELGCHVVSGDVSIKSLEIIKAKFNHTGSSSLLITNGNDLNAINSDSFDLAAVYSVLHHAPDYLHIVEDMIRVTRPGGVIYIDHERNDSFWEQNREYKEFQKKSKRFNLKETITKYSNPQNYIFGLRRLVNPRYQPEGDIHVWPDDHIEWSRIENLLYDKNCEMVLKEDYLLYNRYRVDVYRQYKGKCSDMRVFIARKIS